MIQPTPFCNINCSYCYLPHRSSKKRFDLDLVEPLFAKLEACGLLGDSLTVLWHAGEPLVMPVEFYREAFERIHAASAKRSRVGHFFQTNAMLLSPEYCELFKTFRVQVGISVDGPEFIHDKYRTARGGKGTFRQVMSGVDLLRKHGVPFSAIAVLTADSLDYPHEIYDFFRDLRATSVGFNIDEMEGVHSSCSLASPLTEQRYTAFLATIFQRMVQDKGAVKIRELMQGFDSIQGTLFQAEPSSSESNPFSILSVDVDGNLATFSPELLDLTSADGTRYTIGSVADIDFTKAFSNPAFVEMNDAIQSGVAKCKEACGYFNICGGGAPSNKLAENGSFDSTATLFCRYKKQIVVDVVEDFVMSTLSEQKRSRRGANAPLPEIRRKSQFR